jgi:hypothetical protein
MPRRSWQQSATFLLPRVPRIAVISTHSLTSHLVSEQVEVMLVAR